MGFEPMTCALRVRCSTTELPGRSCFDTYTFCRPPAASVIVGAPQTDTATRDGTAVGRTSAYTVRRR